MLLVRLEDPKFLKILKVNFEILKCDFDESNLLMKDLRFCYQKYPAKMSRCSCDRQKKKLPNKPILTADTIVALDGKIFGKPENKESCHCHAPWIFGRKHSVMTCVCLGETDPQTDAEVKMMFDLVRTEIQFANLTANQCAKYWDTNEPKDKAGAYGIQGYGGYLLNLWKAATATLWVTDR